MISTLEGTVQSFTQKEIVIETGGIGFLVNVPSTVIDNVKIGDRYFLFIHLIVREDSLTLYGFNQIEERDIFKLLLSVNGVGPRAALAITDSLGVDNIKNAVLNEHVDAFSRVPGIGKKTAQKILISMQGKIEGEPTLAASTSLGTDSMVIEALTQLGYSVIEAQTALQSIPKDTEDDIGEKLREALKYFSE